MNMNAKTQTIGDAGMDVITGTLVKAGAGALIKHALSRLGRVKGDRRRAQSLEAGVREAIDAQLAHAPKPADVLACLMVPAFSEALQRIQRMEPLHEDQIRSWLRDRSKMQVCTLALDIFLREVRDAILGNEGCPDAKFQELGRIEINDTTFPVFYSLIRDIEERFITLERESMADEAPASYGYALHQRVLQIDRRLETMWQFMVTAAVFVVAYAAVTFGIEGIEQTKGVVLRSGILDEVYGLAGGTAAALIARLIKRIG